MSPERWSCAVQQRPDDALRQVSSSLSLRGSHQGGSRGCQLVMSEERMRWLMSVIQSGRVDLSPLVTHRFKLDDIEKSYELFEHRRDGGLKVAITP